MSKKCVLSVDKRLFPQDAVLKTAYRFLDNYYVFLSCPDENTVSISIEPKAGSSMVDIEKQFSNELIAQVVHYNISISNRTMKELILGRALYSAFYDKEDYPPIDEAADYTSGVSLDDIAVDWFDVYGTEN